MIDVRRHLSGIVSAIAAIGLLCGLALPASAQSPDRPAVILVVDQDALFRDSLVAQDIRRQINEYAESIKAEAESAQAQLKADAQRISDQRDTLSEVDMRRELEALQLKERELQQSIGIRSTALQLGGEKARREVQAVLEPIVSEVMKRHGATLMFDRKFVLATTAEHNVTAEVMKMLNERLTKLTVKPVDPSELQQSAVE